MRTVRWQQGIAFVVTAALAGWLVNLQAWDEFRSDLLILLSIFAAALIQVAVTTANLALPDYLTIEEADRLSDGLERQQRYWIGLFAAIILTVITVIVASKLHGTSLVGTLPYVGAVDFARLVSAFVGGLFGFLSIHSLVFLRGLLSIQLLRSDFLKKGAVRRAVTKVEGVQKAAQEAPFRQPDGYGAIYTQH